MELVNNIVVFGEPDPASISQMLTCMRVGPVAGAALMADHHKGYAVPIGGVIAYEGAVSPSGVGYDIGCGNKAVRVDTPAAYVRQNISKIMDDIFATISFGVGRRNNEQVDHPVLDESHPGWYTYATRPLKQMARNQLGTVGSGNHYVDIFTDELDRVWIGVHFGSRGLGHKTATWFLNAAGAKDGMDVEPCVLPVESDLGEQYIQAMTLAGQYAYAGRDWVCSRVAKILGAAILEEVHNHHNFAWQEEHQGKELWVVRKGATPAFPGQKGFVGGSMAEPAVIVEGRPWLDSYEQIPAFFSTVHGAGRVMGRREAAGKYRIRKQWGCGNYRNCDFMAAARDLRKAQGGANPLCPKCGSKLHLHEAKEQLSAGRVTQEMMTGWLDRGNVVLRGGGLDESPDCYKRLPDVLAAHSRTIRVLHTLRPLGVAMAGANEFDPYKD